MNTRRARYLSYVTYALFAGALLSLVLYALEQRIPSLSDDDALYNNLGFFLLINTNIIIVMILGFMVLRNIIKLILDRRRNILGSRLRARLVVAFVGLSLIPTVLLFFVAKGIVGSVLQGWFSPQVVATVDAAMGVARNYYELEAKRLTHIATHLVTGLEQYLGGVAQEGVSLAADPAARELLEEYLTSKREEYGLAQIQVSSLTGDGIVSATDQPRANEGFLIPPPNIASLQKAVDGEVIVSPEQSIAGEYLRAYLMIPQIRSGLGRIRDERLALVVTQWIAPELRQSLAEVLGEYDEYRELRTYRRPIASSYLLTLVIVTLMIVFAAIWVGFYLAKSLSGPIQLLAQGTEAVAQGNLDYRIPEVGDDELGVLVHSFNTMTEDLEHITGELVSRKRYMETVLASVGVGVVAVDRNGTLTMCNIAAGGFFSSDHGGAATGKHYREVFPVDLETKVEEMLKELYSSPEKVFTSSVSLVVQDKPQQLQVTVNKLVNDSGEILGAVILLDDLTELTNAQRMAAWREVARRIAHEIKNPLTPIQLSAQRIQRRFGREESDGGLADNDRQIINDCAETIVSQVMMLRNLVNEFSQFARMPKVNPRSEDLNVLIRETVTFFKTTSPNIKFVVELDEQMPQVLLDREQLGRVFINLLDNSVASINTKMSQLGSGANYLGEVVVESQFDEQLGLAIVRFADNGIGIPESDKGKIFEPYFTTKKGGTGLGLAIAGNIVADHQGYIRVKDNIGEGTIFVIELPVSRGVLSADRTGT